MDHKVVKAGTKAWFDVSFRGAEVFEFTEETPVTVREIKNNPHWVASVGHVQGAPHGHPAILIPVDGLRSE